MGVQARQWDEAAQPAAEEHKPGAIDTLAQVRVESAIQVLEDLSKNRPDFGVAIKQWFAHGGDDHLLSQTDMNLLAEYGFFDDRESTDFLFQVMWHANAIGNRQLKMAIK